MKIQISLMLLLFTGYLSFGQNEIKVRIEFEAAEQAFSAGQYGEAGKRVLAAEELLGKWQPNLSFLKIQILNISANFSAYDNKTTLALAREVRRNSEFVNREPDNRASGKSN